MSNSSLRASLNNGTISETLNPDYDTKVSTVDGKTTIDGIFMKGEMDKNLFLIFQSGIK